MNFASFSAQGPHSYILMTGGPSDFFGSKVLAKSYFLGLMKHAEIFLGHEKKQRDFFWVAKQGLRFFFGYAKKSSDFFGQTNSEVVNFLGIKYEPLSDPPPRH